MIEALCYSNLMPLHVIYVSGLGDHFDSLRRLPLRLWRLAGISAELFPVYWTGREEYDEKITRLNEVIDKAKGKRIVLIGESAGGSMVLNVYASRPDDFHKVMTICGKNSRPEHVSPLLYKRNPAFKVSMHSLAASVSKLTKVQRQNFISIHPLYDAVVPVTETLIPDCQSRRLWLIGHRPTITFMLLFGAWYVARLAK